MREETRKMAEGKDKDSRATCRAHGADQQHQASGIYKPNHAVGEVYKPNIHDPHEMYRWEEPVSGWVWAGRALFCLGFFVGIYMLTLLTFLF
jgi:hypothetical protein